MEVNDYFRRFLGNQAHAQTVCTKPSSSYVDLGTRLVEFSDTITKITPTLCTKILVHAVQSTRTHCKRGVSTHWTKLFPFTHAL